MAVTLDEVIDAAMQLSPEQQEMLVDVIYRRHVEKRRQEIARDAHESLVEYRAGKFNPQPLEEILKELGRSLDEDA